MSTSLTNEQLKDGYEKATANAFRLLNAALILVPDNSSVALGLAEIGQEELGKSLSLLAAFSLPKPGFDWAWLWSGWRNHQLKAHRAFLYELISPLRLELRGSGARYSGFPVREKIQHEKESSFYVNFDAKSGRFISPEETVDLREAVGRVLTLLYLAITATATQEALNQSESDFRFAAFSEIALRICSENIYQQDMPAIYADFKSQSSRHQELLNVLEDRLSAGKNILLNLIPNAKIEA
jgi:AbiV family abortive infection protein